MPRRGVTLADARRMWVGARGAADADNGSEGGCSGDSGGDGGGGGGGSEERRQRRGRWWWRRQRACGQNTWIALAPTATFVAL